MSLAFHFADDLGTTEGTFYVISRVPSIAYGMGKNTSTEVRARSQKIQHLISRFKIALYGYILEVLLQHFTVITWQLDDLTYTERNCVLHLFSSILFSLHVSFTCLP